MVQRVALAVSYAVVALRAGQGLARGRREASEGGRDASTHARYIESTELVDFMYFCLLFV